MSVATLTRRPVQRPPYRSERPARRWVRRAATHVLRLLGCLVSLALLVSSAGCEPWRVTDSAPLRVTDPRRPGSLYYSNRDVGVSVRLTGVDSRGRSQARDLWVFGDSDGWDAETGRKFSHWFPTNSGSLVRPVDGATALPPMPAEFVRDDHGDPDGFTELIVGGRRPPCPEELYQARWPTGAVRLPEEEPRRETALVFYQDMCVGLGGTSYEFGTGGVARVVWDADAPDAPPRATPLPGANAMFYPGRWHNYYLGTDDQVGSTYGGLYLTDGPTPTRRYLNALACSPASDCVAGRVVLDVTDPTGSLRRVATITAWEYRAEGPTYADTDDVWVPVPDDPCSPTPYALCGTLLPAKPVIRAGADRLTQVWGAPSVAEIGGDLVVTYQPGPSGEDSLHIDHVAVRVADPETGIFGAPHRGFVPSERCTWGCYAPVLHPHLTDDDWVAFSYVAVADHPVGPEGTPISTLRLGWTCREQILTGDPCRP